MNCCNKEYFSHIHVLFKCVYWAFISKIAGVSAILATSVTYNISITVHKVKMSSELSDAQRLN